MGIRILALTACTLLLTPRAFGGGTPAPGAGDLRMRVSAYAADEIYRLKGYVGYQIDLQFEPGESFVGLGAGDLESLGFAAHDNHLFLKPRAAQVDTNLTVLTTRRTYQFDYTPARSGRIRRSGCDLRAAFYLRRAASVRARVRHPRAPPVECRRHAHAQPRVRVPWQSGAEADVGVG